MGRQRDPAAGSGATPLPAAGRTALTTTGVIGMRFEPSNPLDRILIHSANLSDAFLPNGLHPLWGSAVEAPVRTGRPSIGAWTIALGGADARCAARRAGIGLTARVWSLGSLVHIGATRTATPLPYQVLPALPGPERTRRPGHFVGMATLMPAPLAALGRQAFRRRATHRHGHLPAGGTPADIEDAPPHRSRFPFRPHPSYARIAVVPGSGIERTFVSSHGRCGARLSNRRRGCPAIG